MDRRRFLQIFGTGVVATATMAEAGFFADFMAWIKRKPVWSIPTTVTLNSPPILNATIEQYADYVTLCDSPLATIYYEKRILERLKNSIRYWEGTRVPWSNIMAVEMYRNA